MCSYFSDDTGTFPNINKTKKNYIKGASGAQLVTSLDIFSTWILIQTNTVLDGQNNLCWSPEFMLKNIGTFCVMLERKIFCFMQITKGLET